MRYLLRQNRVTQRDLAAALGMHEQTFSNKMCGTRPFTLRDLTRIADFFDVSVDFLLGRSDYGETVGGGVMFGFVSLGVSFASLVISCAALYWSRMARIEAAGAVERSRYALESSRKHVAASLRPQDRSRLGVKEHSSALLRKSRMIGLVVRIPTAWLIPTTLLRFFRTGRIGLFLTQESSLF